MLMVRHVAHHRLPLAVACLVVSHPLEGLLQEVLTDRCAVHQVFAQSVGSAIRFGEVPFGIADERPCKDGVVDFLLVERFAGNVDGLEPLQFFRWFTFAHIDGQGIVENLLLDVLWLVEEVLEVDGELAIHIFTQRECPLLSVHHLVGTFGIIAPLHPIHHIQRIAMQHGVDDCLLLLLAVDELTLIRWTDVEPTIITTNALFVIVHVTTGDFTHGHFCSLYCHHKALGCLLRMKILAYVFFPFINGRASFTP